MKRTGRTLFKLTQAQALKTINVFQASSTRSHSGARRQVREREKKE